MANRNHVVGEPYVDVEVIQRAVASVTRRRRYDDMTVRDVRVQLLEARHQRADAARERGGGIHPAESDLQRQRDTCPAAIGRTPAPR